LVEVPVGVHIRLLRHILSLRIVSENRAGDPVEALVVPTHDDLKQAGLPGPHAPHDLFVRDRKALGILSQ